MGCKRFAGLRTQPGNHVQGARRQPAVGGHLGDPALACSRAPRCAADYQGRISGPFLDRIDLRIDDTYFPVASSIMDITWTPESGQFALDEATIQIGQSRAYLSGVFAMGLDPKYGSTIGIAISGRDISIHPGDMDAPAAPFDSVSAYTANARRLSPVASKKSVFLFWEEISLKPVAIALPPGMNPDPLFYGGSTHTTLSILPKLNGF